MRAHFVLGPAGSGKTTRCLEEIRRALADPEGPPLLMLAPKQATFQIERQILSFPEIAGYARLQILSFERLAEQVLENLDGTVPALLGEEGRLMVLRALLMEKQAELRVFHATARLPGFARQLSVLLRECQRAQLTPSKLMELALRLAGASASLSAKLADLGLLLQAYLDWLGEHQLIDASRLLDLATERLKGLGPSIDPNSGPFRLAWIWMDGFAEMTPQELDLLAAILPCAEGATLAFCLDAFPDPEPSWLSTWAVVARTFRGCWQRVSGLPSVQVELDILKRDGHPGRFGGCAALQRLESHWTIPLDPHAVADEPSHEGICLMACEHPEAEAVMAAREVLRFVRGGGGRFRDVAVLVRSLDTYQAPLRRVFARFGIPIFMDRREPVSHHPLAEFTRSALRVAALQWRHEDLFSGLKTGLTGLTENEVDWLENAALSNGWEREHWTGALASRSQGLDLATAERLQARILAGLGPFVHTVTSAEEPGPSGIQMAAAIRQLWNSFGVEQQLQRWSEAAEVRWAQSSHVHGTVWQEMQSWVDNVERAFGARTLTLREWLPVLEAGLGSLTVGVIPPALDQVLIGAIDRSRNPELKLAVVLGMNDNLFPASPSAPRILTESERERLATEAVSLTGGARRHVGHERYYGYIACTRASQRLVVSWSRTDGQGNALHPSPFVEQIRRLFPLLEPIAFTASIPWREAEHAHEMAVEWLREGDPEVRLDKPMPESVHQLFGSRLSLDGLRQRWQQIREVPRQISPASVEAIFGNRLVSSVSALEDYAACPFKFFVGRGLGAREREEFEVDARERGSFQHALLQAFHEEITQEGRRWRDLAPHEAGMRVRTLGGALRRQYRGGLFESSPASAFAGAMLVERTARLMEILVGWMSQYLFDPLLVEADFGFRPDGFPGLEVPLEGGKSLKLRGRIDRIDVARLGDEGDGLLAVIDYKSSSRELDPVKLEHGLQLQLMAYLAALGDRPEVAQILGFRELRPAGAFYVCLNPASPAVASRQEAGDAGSGGDVAACRHRGRFNREWLEVFDRRRPGKGDQFHFSIKKDGTFGARTGDASTSEEFRRLIEDSVGHLTRFGNAIFAGGIAVSPAQVKTERACDYCDFRSVCRFDPWLDRFRVLKARKGGSE